MFLKKMRVHSAIYNKIVKNCVGFLCCVFCFICGSWFSLNTIDPGDCSLTLCTKRLQHMTISDNNQWLENWKSASEKDVKRVFLVVIIFSAPSNFEARNSIRQTWLSEARSDTQHYFVIGINSLNGDLNTTIQSEQKRFSDLLLLNNVKDSYTALTKKLLASLLYIHQNVQFRFLLKCDDDSYVQLQQLHYELKSVPFKQRVYWGFFDGRAPVFRSGPWKEPNWILCNNYLPYALGGGYIISHDLVAFVATNSKYLQLYNSEDISLSVWLAPIQLHRIHDTKFDTEYKSRGCHNDYIVTHKQTVLTMREKFNNLQLRGSLCREPVQLRKSYNYNWSVPPSQCCIRNDSSIP